MIGQTISHYKILEKLGEGGMGVVYKAEDTKLDRMVALKFLPQHLAASEQDKARFIQEAKAASSLNHPNVCTIHDIQEHDGQLFIVMEFVDGQTLREKKGAISYKQALDIGIQIADGLAAAHEKGIIHRDIKPENIMIRKDGIAQIMDFGLAKLRATGSRITRLTKEGSTVGTAGYMSPEQVQGHDTDHRSDIFSYGVLLYELLTGQLPFKGVHETALAYEIVNVDPPPMSSIKTDIDPSLDAIVLECLEKDVNERAQGIKQISVDLKRYKRESSRQRASRVTAARPVYSSPGVAQEPVQKAQRLTTMSLIGFGLAFIFLIAAGVLAFIHFTQPEQVDPIIRSNILPPKGNFIFGSALSPDGTKLAFVAVDSTDVPRLWVRSLHSFSSIILPGTENAFWPFWSPDGRFIGFFADKMLKKTEASGGGTVVLCSALSPRGGTWGSDGGIIFCTTSEPGLQRVSSQGGTPTFIAKPSSPERIWQYPVILPERNAVLYASSVNLMAVKSGEENGIYARSLESNEEHLLIPQGANPYYASGYLLFMRESELMAQVFDPSRLRLMGEAVVVAQQVDYSERIEKGLFTVSQSGLLVYHNSFTDSPSELVICDRAGKVLQQIETKASYDDPMLSKDGTKLAVSRYDNNARGDIWVCELVRGTMSRFTSDPSEEDDPVWSPDGKSIIYSREGNLVRKSADGLGEVEVLYDSPSDKVPYDVSHDGKFLLYVDFHQKTGRDLWVLPLEGDKKPIPVAVTEFTELNSQFSPDGKWIAYSSNETGRPEVYVQSFPNKGGKVQISTQGGVQPRWTIAGKEIIYADLTGNLFAVDINTEQPALKVGISKELFKADIGSTSARCLYDVTSDGLRVVTMKLGDQNRNGAPLNFVQNWTTELRTK